MITNKEVKYIVKNLLDWDNRFCDQHFQLAKSQVKFLSSDQAHEVKVYIEYKSRKNE